MKTEAKKEHITKEQLNEKKDFIISKKGQIKTEKYQFERNSKIFNVKIESEYDIIRIKFYNQKNFEEVYYILLKIFEAKDYFGIINYQKIYLIISYPYLKDINLKVTSGPVNSSFLINSLEYLYNRYFNEWEKEYLKSIGKN